MRVGSQCFSTYLTPAVPSKQMPDDGHVGHDSFDGEAFEASLEGFDCASEGVTRTGQTARTSPGEQDARPWRTIASRNGRGRLEHRDNTLNGDFGEIGIGARTGETYVSGVIYTANFGIRH